jgi:hypothetical protein
MNLFDLETFAIRPAYLKLVQAVSASVEPTEFHPGRQPERRAIAVT